MTDIKSKTALITGGASGIGKLMGRRFLDDGATNLIIWDIDENKLEETSEEFQDQGFSVYPYLVDLGDLDQIREMALDVKQAVGHIDILVNNAGIVVGKKFVDHSHEDIAKTININVLGVMHVTRAFLPGMIEKGSLHIINIASAAGLVGNPNMSVYASSKWAVLGWSESLRLELEALEGDFRVTTVCPSYIDTGMFEGVKAPLLTPLLKPEEIVDQIMTAVKRNEVLLMAPKIVKLIPFLRGVLPTKVFDFTAEKLGVYDSMSTFKGKGKANPSAKTDS
ncbi:MAG: SDR family oxidoreductase [Cyclobacteriaceae bacterium]|nr:SDR family oxidoreductase [Cyclobacteriaceae bacterium]